MTTLRGFSWATYLAAVLCAHSGLCDKTADPPTPPPAYKPVVVYRTRNSYTGNYDYYPPTSYNQKYRNSNPSYFGGSYPPNSYHQNYYTSNPSHFDGSYQPAPKSYNQNYDTSNPSHFDGSYHPGPKSYNQIYDTSNPSYFDGSNQPYDKSYRSDYDNTYGDSPYEPQYQGNRPKYFNLFYGSFYEPYTYDQNPTYKPYENIYDQKPTSPHTPSSYKPSPYKPRRKSTPRPTPKPYTSTLKPTTSRPNQPLDYCRQAEGAVDIFSTFGPTAFQLIYKGTTIGVQAQVVSTRQEMSATIYSEDVYTLASLGFLRSIGKFDLTDRRNDLFALKVYDSRRSRPSCFIASVATCNVQVSFEPLAGVLYDYVFRQGKVNVDFKDALKYRVNRRISRAMLERDNPILARFCEEAGNNLYTVEQGEASGPHRTLSIFNPQGVIEIDFGTNYE